MAGILLIIIYNLFILYVTLFPFHLKGLGINAFLDNTYKLFHPASVSTNELDLFANVVLFGILGAMCAAFFAEYKDRYRTVVGALYVSLYIFFLNTFIEVLQADIPGRVSSIVDLLVSVAAAVAGFLGVAVLKEAGIADALRGKYYALLRENPMELLWIALGSVLFIGGVYPFCPSLYFAHAASNVNSLFSSFFPAGFAPSDFFLDGLPYFAWGSSAVAASLKEEGSLARNAARKVGASILLIMMIELCKIFIATRHASFYDVAAYSFWVAAGAFAAYPLSSGYRRYPALLSEERACRSIGEFFWLCLSLTVLLVLLQELQPFAFRSDAGSFRQQLGRAELIPFKSYIYGFKSFTVEDAAQKAVLYFALGFETVYYLMRRRALPAWKAIAASSIGGGLLALSVSALQLFIPTRFPSVTYIIIAILGSLAGGALAKRMFFGTCGIKHVRT